MAHLEEVNLVFGPPYLCCLIFSWSSSSFEHTQGSAYYPLFLWMEKHRLATGREKSFFWECPGPRCDQHETSGEPSLHCLQGGVCRGLHTTWTLQLEAKKASSLIGRGQLFTARGWAALAAILPQAAKMDEWAEVSTSATLAASFSFLVYLPWGLGPLHFEEVGLILASRDVLGTS